MICSSPAGEHPEKTAEAIIDNEMMKCFMAVKI
jgi:hypothetical protein